MNETDAPTGGSDHTRIHLSMAVDRGFEVPLAVALSSLAETHVDLECAVSILCSGIEPPIRRRIETNLGDRLEVEWIEVSGDRLAGAHHTEGLTSATLYRILLPELLPADQTRTIYLDADTIVRGPLTELWHHDLGASVLAAVRDAGSPYAAGPGGTDWRGLGLAPDAHYFNAGMLVIPLDRWRAEGLPERTLELLRRTATRWGDQDALNVVAAHRWLELPRRWNVQTADADGNGLAWALWRADVESAVADPAVVHFTGDLKPWRGRPDHPFAADWFNQLGRTDWADWQPGDSALRRSLGRIRRAGSVLLRG